ncbi:mitotic checkpoint serine/threonine-protein kinase BUB1 beta [Chanos chanos]|uniref:Mitotic checkpoint serine/threonine-protein kinase BUB1 beta n=1 Tax=Chanos chanos TaxID=29144 RepID=A0A6J2UU43_CHACN|nr:mitotic checkpoint serine/threonine-protein kinase BUB1 beta [Chanos chanos]
MAESNAEWELCKENIQPLRRGRAISTLQQALSQQLEGSSTYLNQQKQAFESELRMYDGDDPMDVWDRYIKWTEQTYPQGGKESNLSVLLETAVMRFTEEKKYHNDPRYVDLWIKFADMCHEPLDIFRYMQAQGIGVKQSALYIAWSEEYEKRGNFRMADRMFQEGLKSGAESHDKLQQFHKALQARAARQAVSSVAVQESDDDDQETPEPQRMSLVELKALGKKKAVAPISRTGTSARHTTRGLQLKQPLGTSQNRQFVIFDENKASGSVPDEPKLESWKAPPSSRAKENEQRPEKWSNVKKSRFGHSVVAPPSKPNFQPFVEESDQPPVVTPCKINPAVNTILSARKPCREETPLKRLQEQQQHTQVQLEEGKVREQSMYCKELLLSGTVEFCFEELRAERYRQKHAQSLEGSPSEDNHTQSGLAL